jgi:hypothetical protein
MIKSKSKGDVFVSAIASMRGCIPGIDDAMDELVTRGKNVYEKKKKNKGPEKKDPSDYDFLVSASKVIIKVFLFFHILRIPLQKRIQSLAVPFR